MNKVFNGFLQATTRNSTTLKILLRNPKYCFGTFVAIVYFFCSPHLLNYQFAKNFRIKKLCRLLAHIDQRSPWAFIFIIIAFYFLWFWQNESLGSIFKPGLSENEWNGWSGRRCWHPRWWGQDWGQDTSRVRTCPHHPASDAGVSPMDSGERVALAVMSPVTPWPPPRLRHTSRSLYPEISKTWGSPMLIWH